ncbi:hypothetical protein, partial [Hydrogenivirga sp. 128-5-R1-1]|uniref:hypothetical protein n=1 Tax=Hydrogenivirga sp. 128-5-R1-1 TaxID=392423 RepID=UPI00015F276F
MVTLAVIIFYISIPFLVFYVIGLILLIIEKLFRYIKTTINFFTSDSSKGNRFKGNPKKENDDNIINCEYKLCITKKGADEAVAKFYEFILDYYYLFKDEKDINSFFKEKWKRCLHLLNDRKEIVIVTEDS